VIRRGEIWWATLPAPVGSEPGYRRPIIVVQADVFNRSRRATIVAVVITSNIKLSQAPGNVLLPRKVTGLLKDSVANVPQIITVDRGFLIEKVNSLPRDIVRQIDNGLRLVLDL